MHYVYHGKGIFMFAAGVAAGLLGRDALSGQSTRKKLAKTLKYGFIAKDWLRKRFEIIKEDVGDIVADAEQQSRAAQEKSKTSKRPADGK